MRYFTWMNEFEKNNCALAGLKGGDLGELSLGKPLTKKRPKPYTYSMDKEYKRNVKLTDSLYNDRDTIVASPRLRDLLVSQLGKKVEALSVWINDHKGRIASKDYSLINLLDLQDCLVEEQSQPLYAYTDVDTRVLRGVRDPCIDPRKVAKDARLFRMTTVKGPILAREDLVDAVKAAKIVGVFFNEVKTI